MHHTAIHANPFQLVMVLTGIGWHDVFGAQRRLATCHFRLQLCTALLGLAPGIGRAADVTANTRHDLRHLGIRQYTAQPHDLSGQPLTILARPQSPPLIQGEKHRLGR